MRVLFIAPSTAVPHASPSATSTGWPLQLAAKGIRANTVSPGNTYFEGGVWASIENGDPDLFRTAVGLNPTGHMGTPGEVAARLKNDPSRSRPRVGA
jgi:NAD(P)-dependent dehydrogenase (short-subunit alcohol dehydrogenase family)